MPDRTEGSRRLPKFVIWTTLVLICFGFGYSTLNRYDPRQLLPDPRLERVHTPPGAIKE